MSIQSRINNITSSIGDTIDSIVNSTTSKLSGIVNTATTGLSNLYAGGFVGMSRDGMEQLNAAVENYCKTIEDKINEFNDEASRADAYKGEISDAVHVYVEEKKKLLSAYVSTMRKEQEDAANAYNEFHKSEKGFASDIENDSSDVTSDAESIRTESTKISLE